MSVCLRARVCVIVCDCVCECVWSHQDEGLRGASQSPERAPHPLHPLHQEPLRTLITSKQSSWSPAGLHPIISAQTKELQGHSSLSEGQRLLPLILLDTVLNQAVRRVLTNTGPPRPQEL